MRESYELRRKEQTPRVITLAAECVAHRSEPIRRVVLAATFASLPFLPPRSVPTSDLTVTRNLNSHARTHMLRTIARVHATIVSALPLFRSHSFRDIRFVHVVCIFFALRISVLHLFLSLSFQCPMYIHLVSKKFLAISSNTNESIATQVEQKLE